MNRPPTWIPLWALLAIGILLPTGRNAMAADKVIIVVIDGLRATEGLDDPDYRFIPRIGREIAPLGTVARVCDNGGLTLTVPGHACIGSGRYQSLPDDGSVRPMFPHLWEYYRSSTGVPAERTLVIATKAKLQCLAYSTDPDYGRADSARTFAGFVDDGAAIDKLVLEMAVRHPSVVLINLGDVDVAGHTGDWSTYTQVIQNVDSLIYYLWTRVQLYPEYRDRTAFIITGDHGRHSDDYHGHGDGCFGCRRIPLVAVGPDFRVGETSWTPCQQNDLCRTIGLVLGIETPKAGGRVLDEILQVPAAAPAPGGVEKCAVTMRGKAVQMDNPSCRPATVNLFDVSGRILFGAELPPSGTLRWGGPGVSCVLFYTFANGVQVQKGKLVYTR